MTAVSFAAQLKACGEGATRFVLRDNDHLANTVMSASAQSSPAPCPLAVPALHAAWTGPAQALAGVNGRVASHFAFVRAGSDFTYVEFRPRQWWWCRWRAAPAEWEEAGEDLAPTLAGEFGMPTKVGNVVYVPWASVCAMLAGRRVRLAPI